MHYYFMLSVNMQSAISIIGQLDKQTAVAKQHRKKGRGPAVPKRMDTHVLVSQVIPTGAHDARRSNQPLIPTTLIDMSPLTPNVRYYKLYMLRWFV